MMQRWWPLCGDLKDESEFFPLVEGGESHAETLANFEKLMIDNGLTARDGLLVMLGFLLTAVAGYIIWSAWLF